MPRRSENLPFEKEKSSNVPSSNDQKRQQTINNLRQVSPAKPATASSHTPSVDFKASDPSTLKAGQRVEHQKFGFGTIKKMDINGTDRKATVAFDKEGEKTLLLSFAKLRVVE